MINPRLLTSRARQKTCPFINNFETASATNVIYFITWSQLKNLYFSERKATGRILREHHRVVGMTNTHLKQSSDTNHCKLHALKQTNKKVSFKLALLTPPPLPRSSPSDVGEVVLFSSDWPKTVITTTALGLRCLLLQRLKSPWRGLSTEFFNKVKFRYIFGFFNFVDTIVYSKGQDRPQQRKGQQRCLSQSRCSLFYDLQNPLTSNWLGEKYAWRTPTTATQFNEVVIQQILYLFLEVFLLTWIQPVRDDIHIMVNLICSGGDIWKQVLILLQQLFKVLALTLLQIVASMGLR